MISITIVELSNKKNSNGRRPFKAILFEIYPNECIENNTGTQYNANGITWIKEYCEKHLDSIKGMSLTCEFADPNERVEIIGHGDTGIEDGIPLFNNATMIGTFERGYIANITIDNVSKCVCIGEGTLDEMRYKPFVDSLEKKLIAGHQPKGSIEIFKNPDKDEIEYLDGYKEFGRIPTDFIFSGFALLGITPADKTAALVELNNLKENRQMDEKTLGAFVSDIKSVLIETNSKNEVLETKIVQLSNDNDNKEKTICELNATVAQLQKAIEDIEKERDTSYDETRLLREEIAKIKVAQRLTEMDKALEPFTDEEKEFAKEEIETFKKDPVSVEINSIVCKIKSCSYDTMKKRITEQNAQKNTTKAEDIFGDISEVNNVNGSTSIF